MFLSMRISIVIGRKRVTRALGCRLLILCVVEQKSEGDVMERRREAGGSIDVYSFSS